MLCFLYLLIDAYVDSILNYWFAEATNMNHQLSLWDADVESFMVVRQI